MATEQQHRRPHWHQHPQRPQNPTQPPASTTRGFHAPVVLAACSFRAHHHHEGRHRVRRVCLLPSYQVQRAGGVFQGAPPCSLVEANQLRPDSQNVIGTPAAGLAEALATAKQITWRGQSELPQMPWPQARQGLVLVIDLWSGIGGLLIALLALGVRCIAVSAESQHCLLPTVQKHFPHVVHADSVEALMGRGLPPSFET